MAALQCDICGGSLTMTEGGEFAVCDSCGMKHDKRRMQQKVQEIRGFVKIEGSVQVEGLANVGNLLIRAREYLKMDAFSKVQEYCNKILDIDANNAEAKEILLTGVTRENEHNALLQEQVARQRAITDGYVKLISTLRSGGPLSYYENAVHSFNGIIRHLEIEEQQNPSEGGIVGKFFELLNTRRGPYDPEYDLGWFYFFVATNKILYAKHFLSKRMESAKELKYYNGYPKEQVFEQILGNEELLSLFRTHISDIDEFLVYCARDHHSPHGVELALLCGANPNLKLYKQSIMDIVNGHLLVVKKNKYASEIEKLKEIKGLLAHYKKRHY